MTKSNSLFFQHAFPAQNMVVMLRKAVRFIADELEQAQSGRASRQQQAFRPGQGVKPFFFLSQGRQAGHLDARRHEGPFGGMQLSKAAVNQHQVGQRRMFRRQPDVAPGDDLANAGEIIAAHRDLETKAPVLLPAGQPVHKTDQRADILGAL